MRDMRRQHKELQIMKLDGKVLLVESCISEILEELKNDDRPILVEGVQDEKALELLGVDKERIIRVSSKPMHELAEILASLGCKSIINLLDYDREGRKKTEEIKKVISWILIDEKYRKTLFLKTRTSFAEGLPSAIKSAGRELT